jgi:hypothetical protein
MKNFLVSFLLLILLATPATAQEELMEPTQLRMLITDVLTEIGLYSEDACELLMMTAAHESHLGHYLMQRDNGPARGIFQMEPTTEEDIWTNYLARKPELTLRITALMGDANFDSLQLTGNLLYQIAMARVHYYRVSEALPSKEDHPAMARYWKKYYNTRLGKGRPVIAVLDYRRLACTN